jgi:hypothetical protein
MTEIDYDDDNDDDVSSVNKQTNDARVTKLRCLSRPAPPTTSFSTTCFKDAFPAALLRQSSKQASSMRFPVLIVVSTTINNVIMYNVQNVQYGTVLEVPVPRLNDRRKDDFQTR